MTQIFVDWKNYSNQFRYSIMEMKQTGDFSDVTLVCEDGEIQAHRLVLSTGSRLLCKMLKDACSASNVGEKVELKGILKGQMDPLLDFMYNGQCFVAQNEIEGFLKRGHILELVGLQDKEGQYTKKKLSEEGQISDKQLNLVEEENNVSADKTYPIESSIQGHYVNYKEANQEPLSYPDIEKTVAEKIYSMENNIQGDYAEYIEESQEILCGPFEETKLIVDTTKKAGTHKENNASPEKTYHIESNIHKILLII